MLASGHCCLPRSISGDVKNRLHAVRSKLKERMLTMVRETFHSHALPDDFANRIGPLIGVRRAVIEVLFDPNAPPDILIELTMSDEANRCGTPCRSYNALAAASYSVARSPVDAIPRESPDRFPAPVRTLPGYAKENFMDCRNVLSRRVL
jgi:hypothetical protein